METVIMSQTISTTKNVWKKDQKKGTTGKKISTSAGTVGISAGTPVTRKSLQMEVGMTRGLSGKKRGGGENAGARRLRREDTNTKIREQDHRGQGHETVYEKSKSLILW